MARYLISIHSYYIMVDTHNNPAIPVPQEVCDCVTQIDLLYCSVGSESLSSVIE